jgi:HSP20 family protein
MHSVRTDPFADFDRFAASLRTGPGMMPMDLYEEAGEYVVRFDLPGIDPSSIDVSVENQVLTVTVERSREHTDGVNWLVRERPAGRHSRLLRLGPTVDAGAIDAHYENGVLTVKIPVRPEAQPRRIEVKSEVAAIGS